MKMRNYLKDSQVPTAFEALVEKINTSEKVRALVCKKRLFFSALFVLGMAMFVFVGASKSIDEVSLSDEAQLRMISAPLAATSAKKGTISIPVGTVKVNPFLPYRDLSGNTVSSDGDVPAYNLVDPPEEVAEGSDAARVMDTIVSGILYDKYSPSAIINIEGNDYLVKKGDVVNNYKVLNIVQDSVTVKLGANVYKAGIGEILTEGSLNHNEVSNLNNKFGGVK